MWWEKQRKKTNNRQRKTHPHQLRFFNRALQIFPVSERGMESMNSTPPRNLLSEATLSVAENVLSVDVLSSASSLSFDTENALSCIMHTFLHAATVMATVATCLVRNPACTAASTLGKERHINGWQEAPLTLCMWRYINEAHLHLHALHWCANID